MVRHRHHQREEKSNQASTSLPHLDGIDDHRTVFDARRPRRVPFVLCLGKVLHSSQRSIQPRFIPRTIREPPIRTTNGDIHNQVKVLVKRCRVRRATLRIRCQYPLRPVQDSLWELAPLEERLVELELEELVVPRVDVNTDELRRPLHTVQMESVRVDFTSVGPEAEGAEDTVEPGEGSPVE